MALSPKGVLQPFTTKGNCIFVLFCFFFSGYYSRWKDHEKWNGTSAVRVPVPHIPISFGRHVSYKRKCPEPGWWITSVGNACERTGRTSERTSEWIEGTNERENGRLYKWTKERVSEWKAGLTNERTNKRTNERTKERTKERTNARTNERMNKRRNARTQEQMNERTNERTSRWANQRPNLDEKSCDWREYGLRQWKNKYMNGEVEEY